MANGCLSVRATRAPLARLAREVAAPWSVSRPTRSTPRRPALPDGADWEAPWPRRSATWLAEGRRGCRPALACWWLRGLRPRCKPPLPASSGTRWQPVMRYEARAAGLDFIDARAATALTLGLDGGRRARSWPATWSSPGPRHATGRARPRAPATAGARSGGCRGARRDATWRPCSPAASTPRWWASFSSTAWSWPARLHRATGGDGRLVTGSSRSRCDGDAGPRGGRERGPRCASRGQKPRRSRLSHRHRRGPGPTSSRP